MKRLAPLLCLVAFPAFPADDANRAIENALANRLHAGDAKAAAALFDPAMHGFASLNADLQRLLAASEVNLSFDVKAGVWIIDITSRDLTSGITHRQEKVAIVVKDGLIHSLEPATFLAPPVGREPWDLLFAFAVQLQNEAAAPSLEQFDRATPGFEDLKTAVNALWTRFEIEPSLSLISNEGGDTERTLQVAWILTLKNRQDTVDSTTRERTVICHIEKKAKSWRIVSFSPADLFEMPRR